MCGLSAAKEIRYGEPVVFQLHVINMGAGPVSIDSASVNLLGTGCAAPST